MLLYRVLSVLALVLYAPFAFLRSWTGRRRLGDIPGRLGKLPYPDLAGGIWAHAVSVGEVGVARSLLATLARRAPEASLGLSVTTAAGRDVAERTLQGKVRVFAFPFDLARPVEAALSAVRPGLVLLTETEIWPLFLERAHVHGVPVALVNGRISPRSFARYRLAGSFLAKSLRRISLFAMQSEEDAARIAALGALPQKIHVTGNIKYDLPSAPPFADADRLRQLAAGRKIFVAASTGEGEEAILLEAWRPLGSRILLALTPRRPERFEEVAALIERSGFSLIRRSRTDPPDSDASSPITRLVRRSPGEVGSPDDPITRWPVYLLDSVGELASFYREASFAFVGGSLVATGGHNPIEAWAEGVPVVTGPHMENFREIAERGEQGGFLSRVQNERELSRLVDSWLSDAAAVEARGNRARQFVAANRGAAEATAALVLELWARHVA